MFDPTAGCPGCGTVGKDHGPNCSEIEKQKLLDSVKSLITQEAYGELTFYELDELRKEIEAIKNFVPDPTIGF